jgi:hypothetical protein
MKKTTISSILSLMIIFTIITLFSIPKTQAESYKITQLNNKISDIEQIKTILNKLNKTVKFNPEDKNGVFAGFEENSLSTFQVIYKKGSGQISIFNIHINEYPNMNKLNNKQLSEVNKSINSILKIIYKEKFAPVDIMIKTVLKNAQLIFKNTDRVKIRESCGFNPKGLLLTVMANGGLIYEYQNYSL